MFQKKFNITNALENDQRQLQAIKEKVKIKYAVNKVSDFKPRPLEEALWQTALEALGSAELQRTCALSLRAWIAVGVQRMERQRRWTPEDLTLAHVNLRKFVNLMKREAVFLGKSDYLDNAAFRKARERLRRQGSLATFALWPFWPFHFVATN
jgi:hypothetical protein